MLATRIETTVTSGGELHLTQCLAEKATASKRLFWSPNGVDSAETEAKREEALKRFNARADASKFRSTGLYPTRDELHERH